MTSRSITIKDAIHSLTIFEHNSRELGRSNFIRWMNAHQETSMHSGKGFKGLKEKLPRYESVKAFILTFRTFIQRDDVCSLKYMSRVYSQSRIPLDLKNSFKNLRNIYNEHLDQDVRMKLYIDKKERFPVLKTKRQLMHYFIYGKFAHNEYPKFYITRSIWEDHWFKMGLWPEFLWDLYVSNNLIQNIRKLNKKTIKSIREVKI